MLITKLSSSLPRGYQSFKTNILAYFFNKMFQVFALIPFDYDKIEQKMCNLS